MYQLDQPEGGVVEEVEGAGEVRSLWSCVAKKLVCNLYCKF